MRLHQLRYFAVLAEELHFGRAAQRLAITQPPLSGAIKALENELGVALFTRDSKRVSLTPAGLALRTEAQQILEHVDRAAASVRAVADGLRGRLEIGATGSMLYRELPAIVRRFQAATPGVEVLLRELSTGQQIDELLRGRLDAIFANAGTVPPQLAMLPLAADHFVCCLPKAHPMAANRSLRLAQLADEPFVMFAREVAPANHDNVLAVFSQAGIHPRLVHAARQWLTVIAMVAHGLGVALVPSSLARSRMDGVVFVPLADLQTRSTALLAWRPPVVSAALASFLEAARAELAAGDTAIGS
ncbi:MAG: LysR family transcriptional regulator [Burkholderiaceae bacterium]|nr:LysR family transcriptional regulator [Burkholderiaceae bacterium]